MHVGRLIFHYTYSSHTARLQSLNVYLQRILTLLLLLAVFFQGRSIRSEDSWEEVDLLSEWWTTPALLHTARIPDWILVLLLLLPINRYDWRLHKRTRWSCPGRLRPQDAGRIYFMLRYGRWRKWDWDPRMTGRDGKETLSSYGCLKQINFFSVTWVFNIELIKETDFSYTFVAMHCGRTWM